MGLMQMEIDKAGLRSALVIGFLAVALVALGNRIAGQAWQLLNAPALGPEARVVVTQEQVDENSFYLAPPAGKPVFMKKNDLAKKRNTLVWEKQDFIFVDLDAMSVSLYASGTPRASFPIVAKPEEGSFFATPGGFYTIQGKAERSVSKIDRSRLSWAVYMFGNYLIHAALPGSQTAAAGFLPRAASGARAGGIQLASADAKEVFTFSREGMPALVSGGAAPGDVTFTYFRKSVLPHSVPEVSAASVLAADLETGEILFEKNKNDTFPIASVSKLITALVAEERIRPSQLLVVGSEALRVHGNAAGILKGEAFPASELLYGMILPSSNNVAKMFELAVPDFVLHMNEKARAIGMTHTFFRDSSGLSQENVSSAKDLFALLRYLDTKDSKILAISGEKSHTATSQNKLKTHIWTNINWPRDDKRFLGGKTGFTDDSLQTMAGIYAVRATEYGGRKIGIVVLGSRSRISDIRSIIAYLEQNYVYGFALPQGDNKLHPIASGADIYQSIYNIFSAQ